MTPSVRGRSLAVWVLFGLLIFLGVRAVLGGAALVLDPSGGAVGLSRTVLAGSPFGDFLLPGIVLFMETMPATMGRINGAVFAAAFLAGLIGLFQVISAQEADSRLQLAGFRRWELFCTRLATIVTVSLVAAAAAFAVLAWRVEVAAPVVAFGPLALAGLLYGLLGVLIGAAVPKELDGSLLLVFVADFDDFMASGLANIESPLLHLLPLQYPHKVFAAAVRDGSVAAGDVIAGLAYLVVAVVAVLLAYVTLTDGTSDAATPTVGGVAG